MTVKKKPTKKKIIKKKIIKKVIKKKTAKKKVSLAKSKENSAKKSIKKTSKRTSKKIVKKISTPKAPKIKKIFAPQEFKAGENIVYPTHGVGRILTVEKYQYDLVEEQLYESFSKRGGEVGVEDRVDARVGVRQNMANDLMHEINN